MNFASQKIAIGSAQFGLNYGISNSTGKVDLNTIQNILTFAKKHQITTIDTARSYGSAESELGKLSESHLKSFQIITKIPKLGLDAKNIKDQMQSSIKTSLNQLHFNSVYAILLHDEDDLLSENGNEIWDTLQEVKNLKQTIKIGVSFYSPDKLSRILKRYTPDLIQIPYSILDRRFFSKEFEELYRTKSIEVHTRSVFLQGLFFIEPKKIPHTLDFAKPTLMHAHLLCEQAQTSLAKTSLQFVLSNPVVSKCVLGVTSTQELEQLVDWSQKHPPTKLLDEFGKIPVSEQLLNPALWPKT